MVVIKGGWGGGKRTLVEFFHWWDTTVNSKMEKTKMYSLHDYFDLFNIAMKS